MGDTVVSLAQLEDELKRLVGKYHAQAAYLFGSYARSEAHPDSDLDVLIVGGPDFHAPDVFAIAEELHLRFQKPVDVYEIREIERESLFYGSVMRDRLRVAWSKTTPTASPPSGAWDLSSSLMCENTG